MVATTARAWRLELMAGAALLVLGFSLLAYGALPLHEQEHCRAVGRETGRPTFDCETQRGPSADLQLTGAVVALAGAVVVGFASSRARALWTRIQQRPVWRVGLALALLVLPIAAFGASARATQPPPFAPVLFFLPVPAAALAMVLLVPPRPRDPMQRPLAALLLYGAFGVATALLPPWQTALPPPLAVLLWPTVLAWEKLCVLGAWPCPSG